MQQPQAYRPLNFAASRLGVLVMLAVATEISSATPVEAGPRVVAPCQNQSTALWGLCRDDGSDGPPVMEQRYYSIGPAGTGAESRLFPARLLPNDLSGYLNAAGQWVIKPQYRIAMPFTDGLAVVSDGVNSAAVDSAGRMAVDWFEGLLFPFREGLACAVPRGSIRLSVLGEWRRRLFGHGDEKTYAAPWWHLQGKTGYVNSTGKMVIAPQYDPKLNYLFASCGFNSMGYAAMRLDGKDGLIDRQGNWVIPPRFEYLGIVFSGNRKVLAVVAEHTLKKGIFLDTVERMDGSVSPQATVVWRDPEPAREVPVAGGLARTGLNLLLFPKWQQDLLNDDVSSHTLSAWVGSLYLGAAAALGIWRSGRRRGFNRLFIFAVAAAVAATTVIATFLAGIISLYATAAFIAGVFLWKWRRWRNQSVSFSQA
jgi:hypothetical protein